MPIQYFKVREDRTIYMKREGSPPPDMTGWITCEGTNYGPGQRIDDDCNLLEPLPKPEPPPPTPEELKKQRALDQYAKMRYCYRNAGSYKGQLFAVEPWTLPELKCMREQCGINPTANMGYFSVNKKYHIFYSTNEIIGLIDKIQNYLCDCCNVLKGNMDQIESGNEPTGEYPEGFTYL